MPRYEYICKNCNSTFELVQAFEDAPIGRCPICDGKSPRKFHSIPIIYKGKGFYTTDYKRPTQKE